MRITQINSDYGLNWNFDEVNASFVRLGRSTVDRSVAKKREVANRELNDDEGTLFLPRLGSPVTPPQAVYFISDLEIAIAKLGSYPVVIRPLDAVSEVETTFKVDNWKEARSACKLALPESRSGGVLVEKFDPDRNYKTEFFCI